MNRKNNTGNNKALLFSVISGLCFAAVLAVIYLIASFALDKFNVVFLAVSVVLGFIIGVISDKIAYSLEKDRIVKIFEASGKIEITEGYDQNYIAQLKHDLQKYPHLTAFYLSLAWAYVVNGDTEAAAEVLNGTEKSRFIQNPDGAWFYYSLLVHLYEIQNDKEKIKEVYTEGLPYIKPYLNEPQAKLACAIYEMACENYDKCIEIIGGKIAQSSLPAQQFAVICAYYKAVCMIKTGKTAEAENALSEISDNYATDFYKHRVTELLNSLQEMKINETIS